MSTSSAPPLRTEPEPDPQRQAKARQYARLQRRLGLADMAIGVIVLLALLPGGLSVRLRDALALPQAARVAVYSVILVLGFAIVSLPMDIYSGFVVPRRYGLSTQSFRGWLSDRAKGMLLGLVLGVAAVSILYLLLSWTPGAWWLWAWLLAILFSVLLTNLAPVLIMPLFYKQKPLEDGELRSRLLALAERAKVRVRGVFVIDMSSKGTAANAALMGLGNTRRIVLGDTMLGAYSPEEIESVLAHEMGHHAHRDIPWAIVIQSASSLIGFYLGSLALNWAAPRFGFHGLTDVAAFPVLILVIAGFGVLTRPLMAAYSRWRESMADGYSLRISGNPPAFISMMTKLVDQNLGEAHPARWAELFFYDHPPYHKRVGMARRYAAGNREASA